MINFIIDGKPAGKGRPRFSKWGTYTPPKTKEYENHIKECFIEQSNIYLENALSMELKIYFEITKSTSKKDKQLMLNNVIKPTKKPDIDNIIKAVADALNGLAYKDDSQIIKITAEKYYSEEPRIEVIIKNE